MNIPIRMCVPVRVPGRCSVDRHSGAGRVDIIQLARQYLFFDVIRTGPSKVFEIDHQSVPIYAHNLKYSQKTVDPNLISYAGTPHRVHVSMMPLAFTHGDTPKALPTRYVRVIQLALSVRRDSRNGNLR